MIATRFPRSIFSHTPITRGNGLYLPLWVNGLSGSTVRSIDSFGHECLITGTTISADGRVFDGDDDISLTNVLTRFLSANTVGTILGWFKFDAAPAATSETLFQFGDTDANAQIMLRHLNTGLLIANCRNATGIRWITDTDVAPFSASEPFLVGLVHNGTSPLMYVDGVAPAQAFSTSTDNTIWFAGNGGLDNGFIGITNNNTNGKLNFLNGSCREFWAYDVDLSSTEMADFYSETRGFYK